VRIWAQTTTRPATSSLAAIAWTSATGTVARQAATLVAVVALLLGTLLLVKTANNPQ
jgi:hypothetical protein